MSDRPRDDVDDRIAELEAAVADLREELRSRRGPGGAPRPPRPREFLRFTDDYAIPAAIAALEANVRALELLQAGIRASDPERTGDEKGRERSDRASGVGRSSLDRLDRALAEVESAIEGSGLPRDREAGELLRDARRLNDEIREAVEAGGSRQPEGSGRDGAVRIEVREEGSAEEGPDADGSDDAAAEVEAELETVKDEVASEAERDETEE